MQMDGVSKDGSMSVDKAVQKVISFKYIESYLTSEGGAQRYERVNSFTKRKFSGILCGAKVPRRLNPKIYRTIICPTAKYGSECWKKQEYALMETQTLRWRLSFLERTPNDTFRMVMWFAANNEKLRERWLGCFGHVMTRAKSHMMRQTMELVVDGTDQE